MKKKPSKSRQENARMLGMLIRARRTYLEITQAELARQLGCCLRSVIYYEQGIVWPTWERRKEMAVILKRKGLEDPATYPHD
jgi:transcriptional regulator with XRE-family HTH domain